MRKNSRIILGLILLFISVFLSFYLALYRTGSSDKSIERKPDSASEKQISASRMPENSNTGNAVLAPPPFIKQQGKVKGLNSFVKFEKDFETSLKIQETPKIWLEFVDENNQVKIVELPKQAQEILQKRWTKTLAYSHQNVSTNDRETKFSIQKNYINDAAVFATKIDDFEIMTPLEKRKISLDEAFAMVHLTAEFAIQRYHELRNMNSQVNPQKISQSNF